MRSQDQQVKSTLSHDFDFGLTGLVSYLTSGAYNYWSETVTGQLFTGQLITGQIIIGATGQIRYKIRIDFYFDSAKGTKKRKVSKSVKKC